MTCFDILRVDQKGVEGRLLMAVESPLTCNLPFLETELVDL
jgi:hypothetical protein